MVLYAHAVAIQSVGKTQTWRTSVNSKHTHTHTHRGHVQIAQSTHVPSATPIYTSRNGTDTGITSHFPSSLAGPSPSSVYDDKKHQSIKPTIQRPFPPPSIHCLLNASKPLGQWGEEERGDDQTTLFSVWFIALAFPLRPPQKTVRI